MRFLALAFSLALAAASLRAVPDADGLYATFNTSLGEFTAVLAFSAVPLTVGNFIGLAEGAIPYSHPETGEPTKGRFFDGLNFFSVQDSFFVAAGDPNGDDPFNQEKLHGPGYFFADEMHPDLKHSPTGTLSMFNAGFANSNGSQFLITLAPPDGGSTPFTDGDVDGRNSVFGFVVEGMDVVEAIGDVQTDEQNIPLEPVLINSVTIHRVGDAAEAFSIDERFKLPRLDPLKGALDPQAQARFPVFADNDVIVETSHDLLEWNPQSVSSDTDGFDTLDLASLLGEETDTIFFRAERVNVPSIGQFKPGATFTADILGPTGSTSTWTYNLEADGKGTASVGGGSGNITDYRWYDLPLGAQLIAATDNNFVIAYYLRFTEDQSETADGITTRTRSGGAFVHLIDPNGRRSNTTGDFTFVETSPAQD